MLRSVNKAALSRLIPFDDYIRVRAPVGVAWHIADLQFSTQGVQGPALDEQLAWQFLDLGPLGSMGHRCAGADTSQ